MAFLYETHLHTREGSACAVSPGKEYIRRYLDLGYTGIIITDHFFRGNCQADRNLPWKKWVGELCRGYENAREEGERLGLDVFFGWEETIEKCDYLIYGLDKEWLLEHPEAAFWNKKEQYEEVRRSGGCVVYAHPFRYAYDRPLSPDAAFVDAVEAANAGNRRACDALARNFAEKAGLPCTAGSDIHYAADIQRDSVFGVYLDKKMESAADYVRAVKNNAIAGLFVPQGRFEL